MASPRSKLGAAEQSQVMSRESKHRFKLKNVDFSIESAKELSPRTVPSKDLKFVDFMPLDSYGKPIGESKPGNLHFHCNLGSCLDSVIQERINSYVPKHKSYLKESDLKFVAKKTKEELDAKAAK